MTKKQILGYIFASIALIFEGFFGVVPFVSFVIQVILVSIAVFLFTWIFRRSMMIDWQKTLLRYILTIFTTFGFFISLMLIFVGYQHISPGVISDVTLSRSGQTVVFVQMSHIATPDFYTRKNQTLITLSSSGYTILAEGVKPGTQENQAKFNRSMGFDFTPTFYTTIADLLGLQSQDNRSLFTGISTGSLISVDLSIDDIVTLMGTGTQDMSTGSHTDIESEMRSLTSRLSSSERIWISWVGRGLLNWSLRRSDDLIGMMTTGSRAGLFATIIDRRNDRIVEYIRSHPDKNIVIVYGALHFNGVYESLERIDPSWQIDTIHNTEPYTR